MGWLDSRDNPTEAQLKTELMQARAVYDRAKVSFDEASGHAHSIGFDHPDGVYALHVAAREYGQALARYSEAVKRFASFVLRGKQT